MSEIVSELYEIAAFRRENDDVGLPEMLEGANLAKQLRDIGVDPSELGSFESSFYSRAKEKGYDVLHLVDPCAELDGLEKEFQTVYREILKKFREMGEKLPGLKKQRDDLKDEIAKLEGSRTEALGKNKTTDKLLSDYSATRSQLASLDLNLDLDLQKLSNFLLSAKDQGFDPVKVIKKLNQISNLDKEVSALEERKSKANEDLESVSKKTESAKLELKDKEAVLGEIRQLESTGLKIEQVQKIRNAVVQVAAARQGVGASDAIGLLEKDILERYDKILGFGTELSKLEVKKKGLEEEVRKTESKIEELNKIRSKVKTGIEAYEKLRDKGVDDEKITRWNTILENAKLTPSLLESELKTYADLKGVQNETRKRISGLKEERQKLATAVSELSSKKGELESSINTLKEAGVKQIKDAIKKSSDEIARTLVALNSKIGTTLEQSRQGLDVATTEVQIRIGELETQVNDYAGRVADAARFEEELKIARIIRKLTADTEGAEDVPLDNALVLVNAAMKICMFRGFNPRIGPLTWTMVLGSRGTNPTLINCLTACQSLLQSRVTGSSSSSSPTSTS